MFPPRCAHPPWRNIDVKSVVQKGSGIAGGRSRPAEYSRGTTPHAWTKDSRAPAEGCMSSSTNASTFSATRRSVTAAMPPRPSPSSPTGIIRLSAPSSPAFAAGPPSSPFDLELHAAHDRARGPTVGGPPALAPAERLREGEAAAVDRALARIRALGIERVVKGGVFGPHELLPVGKLTAAGNEHGGP